MWRSRSASRCSTPSRRCWAPPGGRPPRPAGLELAGPAGTRLLLAGGQAPRAAHGDGHHGCVHAHGDVADLAGRRADPGSRGQCVGALRHGPGSVRARSLPAGPADGVHRHRRLRDHCRPAVAAVAHGHRGWPGPGGHRAARGVVLHRAQAAGAGADRARGAGGAGAVPARRAGPGRGTRPAGRRDARRRKSPGEPDGAASRRAADDGDRRGDPAGRGRATGLRLPGPGRAAGPDRHSAYRSGGQ